MQAEPPAPAAPVESAEDWGMAGIVGGVALIAGGWFMLKNIESIPRIPTRLAALSYLPIAAGFLLVAHGLLRAITGSHISFIGSESPDERNS